MWSLATTSRQLEEKKEPLERPRLRAHAAMRGAARKPVRAYLTYYKKVTGAANTAFAGTFPLQPNLDSSWASWQGVFDEVKVLSAVIHFKVAVQVSPSAMAAQTPNTVMVYDPTDASAFTSINQALEYEDYTLLSDSNPAMALSFFPQTIPGGVSGGRAPGFVSMAAQVKTGSQFSASDSLLSSGDWRPTQDASNYYWGNFQSYTSAAGTSAVLQVEAFVRMSVEFRTRR